MSAHFDLLLQVEAKSQSASRFPHRGHSRPSCAHVQQTNNRWFCKETLQSHSAPQSHGQSLAEPKVAGGFFHSDEGLPIGQNGRKIFSNPQPHRRLHLARRAQVCPVDVEFDNARVSVSMDNVKFGVSRTTFDDNTKKENQQRVSEIFNNRKELLKIKTEEN